MVAIDNTLKYQAYYTKSTPILDYMTSMLHFHPQDAVLEPCGGDGVFVDRLLEKADNPQIDVLELDNSAVALLRNKYKEVNNVEIRETDTLLDRTIVLCEKKYDKIIGNPPYGARNDAGKKNLLHQVYTGLYTKESYSLFLYACTRCLKEGGELCFIVPDTFLSLHRHTSLRQYLLANTQIKELALFPSSFFPGVNFGYANLCIITLVKSHNIDVNLANQIKVRMDFHKVEELPFSDKGTVKFFCQKDVLNNVGSAFMFNATNNHLISLINDKTLMKIGDIASCVTGFYSGNDKKYLHPINMEVKNARKYKCADGAAIHSSPLTTGEKENGIKVDTYLVPIVKGGNTEFVKPTQWYMDWSASAIQEYRTSKKCRFQNAMFYFKNGIGIPMIRSSKLTGALIEGRLFDQSIVGVFPTDETLIKYLLAFFNSSVCTEIIDVINPSANNSANYIKKLPFIPPTDELKEKIEFIVDQIISALKSGNTEIGNYKMALDELFENLYYRNIGRKIYKFTQNRKEIKQLSFLDAI